MGNNALKGFVDPAFHDGWERGWGAALFEVRDRIVAETTPTDREFDTGYQVVCRLLAEDGLTDDGPVGN